MKKLLFISLVAVACSCKPTHIIYVKDQNGIPDAFTKRLDPGDTCYATIFYMDYRRTKYVEDPTPWYIKIDSVKQIKPKL